MVDPLFWSGKRVFLTGHTGFKGAWLALWLVSMGAKVKGFALPPNTEPNLFEAVDIARGIESEFGDVRDRDLVCASVADFSPDILIHMAAQPLVRLSYSDPIGTFATNVMGTAHVLEAARNLPGLRAIISVTTDKCYENREWPWGYRENEPLGGRDPYSSSKACAELVSASYRNSFFSAGGAAIATARAGNVIGGGDWAEDRLVPDLLRAFATGQPALIRNPMSTRPWQHVLEPLSGYLMLAEALWHKGGEVAEAWNFGPRDEDARPVQWIVKQMVCRWGQGASWTRDEASHPHEASFLKLDTSKARARLGWEPVWDLAETLRRIVDWHKAWLSNADMRTHCLSEIDDYTSSRRERIEMASSA